MSPPPDPALLTVSAAADRLGMSERSLRDWMGQPGFPLKVLRRGRRSALSSKQVQRYCDAELEASA